MSDLDARGFIHRVINGQHCLVPADIAAEEFLNDVKVDREVLVTVRLPRHPEHHRWFFWFLNRIVQNVPGWDDIDDLLDAIKLAVGHVRRIQMLTTSETILIPKSISFAAMGEERFKRFVARAKHVLAIGLKIDVDAYAEEATKDTKRIRRS